MEVSAISIKIKGYDSLRDEDIVIQALDGDSHALDYLLEKYKNFVRAKARSYFLIGADREDSPGRNDRPL